MDQISNEVSPAPGQLWKNVRTGDVLFIYRTEGEIEGVFVDGGRKSNVDVMKIAGCSSGWTCVYHRPAGAGYEAQDPRFV